MPATARLVINQSELRTQLVGPGGLVTRHVIRQIRLIRNKAVLYCPVDTGNLRSSITSATRTEGLFVIGRVGTAVEYAVDVHEGHPAMSVTVPASTVKAHTRKDGTKVKAHVRKQHWRTISARSGRPFLRRAMEEVIDRGA